MPDITEKDLARVMLAIPNMGWIHADLCELVHHWRRMGMQYYAPSGLKPNDHARNSCVKHFLASRADYLFFVDHDTVPTVHAPLTLMRARKDIISGCTPIVTIDPNTKQRVKLYTVNRHGTAPDGSVGLVPATGVGIEEIDACGAACLMISRRVLEAFRFPFRVRFDEDGLAVLGQDYSFCASAIEAGFKVFVDFNVLCGHYKDVMLR